MQLFIVLSVLYFAAVVAFHYCALSKGPKSITVSKSIASLLFVIIALTGMFYAANTSMFSLGLIFTLGLLFGFLGDILLALRNIYPHHKNKFIASGLSAFAVGHIFYLLIALDFFIQTTLPEGIQTLTQMPVISGFKLVLPFCFGAGISAIYLKFADKFGLYFGKLKGAVAFYSFLVAFLLALTWAASIFKYISASEISMLFPIIPITLFAMSDIVLSITYFNKEQNPATPKQIIIIHVAYYLAQYIFASFVVMIAKYPDLISRFLLN